MRATFAFDLPMGRALLPTAGDHRLLPPEPAMQTLDDMLSRHLLSPDQHQQIAAWIAEAKTPDGILEMPAELWRSLELASKLLGFDADMQRPPPLGAVDTGSATG